MTKFNKELLLFCINRDNAILQGEYESLNRNTIISFVCGNKECNGLTEKIFRYLYEEGGSYCKKCTNKIKQDKVKENYFNRTGIEHPLKDKKVIEKRGETNIKKYGNKCSLQNKDIKDKVTSIMIERYGYSCSLQNKDIRDKGKVTNLNKYGVEWSSQNSEIKEKVKKTNIEKYGVECTLNNDDVIEKIKNTLVSKYGVDNPMKSEEFREKAKQTNIVKYGYEYPQHNPNIIEKMSKTMYRRKDVITPSGKILYMQGYEPQAYKILLNTYKEDEIITNKTEVPEIWWVDRAEKKHRYYVDFYVPKNKLMIEVKSTRTYYLDSLKEKIQMTSKACKDSGYSFEIWIIGKKGNILQTIT